ncbi:MAG: hypothetical protein IM535_18640 [Pseudanabaena sp. M38BS1SP1A06MG]|nr:hypothetical protein [Pseudanabaena sp. M38BS1SP1A06MG]
MEAHPEGVRFHKPRKSTNDLGQQEGKLWGKVGKLPYKAKRIVSPEDVDQAITGKFKTK